MATISNLAVKISADATGFTQKLTPVERAIKQLDAEASKVTEVFKTFGTATEGAGRAQQQFATDLAFLQSALRTGKVDSDQFVAEFAKISEEATKTAAAFREGAALTEANRTVEEKRAAELARLNELLELGAINQETFNRASVEASGAGDAARAAAKAQADAEKARTDAATRAAAIVEANLTREQKAQRDYGVATRELNALRKQGLLTEDEYSAALQRVSREYAKATLAADKFGQESGKAGDAGKLKFNELSGVLSLLPGPIGNVAGRLSGLASAGEGLSRVFAGGLSQGISSIGASVVGLINPFNAAVAGVAAFGAGAAAVARGLVDLEDRVEKLGNTADKLGVSFEFIQTLEAAAARSGTSIDAVSTAFGRLQKSVTGVDEESKTAQAALKNLGITAEELQALKPEEQYKLIGERLQGIADPAQRTATAINLFGKTGAELLPFFKNLGGAADDMERFGRALTAVDRRRIDDFGAGLDALAVATQGLGQTLLLPVVGLGEGLAKAAAEFTAVVTSIADVIGRLLGPALTQIGSVVQAVASGIGLLTPVFRLLADVVEPLAEFILPGVVAQLVFINRIAIAGVIRSMAAAFTTAASAAIAYATSAGVASAATATLAASVRSLLASTGIGLIPVAVGLAAQAFIEWGISSADAAESVTKSGDAAKQSGEDAAKAAEQLNKAIGDSRKALDSAIAKAAEFGQAGFRAAYEFQQALADLQEQADAKELNADQYARGVANATAEFDRQIDSLKRVQEETKRAADEAQKRVDADRQVTEQLLEQARIDRDFGGDNARFKASESVLAVEREIARVRAEVMTARNGGDYQAVDNGKERLRQLENIIAIQRSIADGSAKAAEDERKRLDDQRKRVTELLDAAQEQSQVEKDIIAVQEQQAFAQKALNDARRAGNQEEATAAATRLAALDGLETKLIGQRDAIDQGFADGFTAAFDKVDEAIGTATDKATEFGDAGAGAARRLEEGIAAAKAQAKGGILDKEAFDAEVRRQQEFFDNELKGIEEAAQARLKNEELVNGLINAQRFDGDNARVKAAENLLAIEQEIKLAQEAVAKARADGDREAVAASVRRLADLDQVRAKERDVASGAAQQREEYEKAYQKQVDEATKQRQDQQQQIQQEQQRIAEEERKAAEAEAKRQEERLEKLNTLGERTIKAADVRTTEGASLVVSLAAAAQDPALIQQRLQTKLLERMNENLAQAAANYFNSPVAIVGYSSFGQR